MAGTGSGQVPGCRCHQAKGHGRPDVLQLRVHFVDEDMGTGFRPPETHFMVSKTMGLGKLMRAYSDKYKFAGSELRFLFDGRRVLDGDTPRELGMEDTDVLEVFMALGTRASASANEDASKGRTRT